MQLTRPLRSSLVRVSMTGLVDENPPHRFGCGCKEMSATIPMFRLVAINQPEIGFVHEGGRLQRVPGGLLGHLFAPPVTVIHKDWQKLARSRGSPCSIAERIRVTWLIGERPDGVSVPRAALYSKKASAQWSFAPDQSRLPNPFTSLAKNAPFFGGR